MTATIERTRTARTDITHLEPRKPGKVIAHLHDEHLEQCRQAHLEAFQRNGTAILAGFNRARKHVYGGTVDPVTVADRRRRNRAARKSRRINRGRK